MTIKSKNLPLNGSKTSPKSNYKTPATTKPTKIVTCSLCGRPVAYEKAYCVINGPTKKYYCSKEEFDGGASYLALRDKYENGIKDFVKFIINSDVEMITFTSMLNAWLQDAPYQKIYYYLQDKQDELRDTIANKQIEGSVGRLKYLNAVIVNNIIDYKPVSGRELVTADSSMCDNTDYNIYAPRMLPRRNMRRSMEELEDIFSGNKN